MLLSPPVIVYAAATHEEHGSPAVGGSLDRVPPCPWVSLTGEFIVHFAGDVGLVGHRRMWSGGQMSRLFRRVALVAAARPGMSST